MVLMSWVVDDGDGFVVVVIVDVVGVGSGRLSLT